MENKITFTSEDNEKVDFFVLEETKLNGNNYLLVSESVDEEEAVGYIMKEMADKDGEISYAMVEDETELSAVGEVFEELLEDEIDIIAE